MAVKCFEPAELLPEPGPVENPGRGWYQIFTFRAERESDLQDARGVSTGTDTLALVRINIGCATGRDLSGTELDRIGRIFTLFEERSLDMILRVVYDTDGRGMEREPCSVDRVLRHMEQLGEIIRPRQSGIHCLQGILVGNWGEMHGSRYLSPENLCRLTCAWWRAAGESLPVAVRTPEQYRLIRRRCPAVRLGLFVDGLFGTRAHLGTVCREEDWETIRRATETEPAGGEALSGEMWPPEEVTAVLGMTHLNYLNRVYDRRRLDEWKNLPGTGYPTLYDEISARLGYRLTVVGVRWRGNRLVSRITGRKPALELELENSGFGGLHRDASLAVTVDGPAEQTCTAPVACGPWEGVRTITIPLDGEIAGAVYLELRERGTGRPIRLANRGDGLRLRIGTFRT